jgi:hypothetical protein
MRAAGYARVATHVQKVLRAVMGPADLQAWTERWPQ